MTITISAFERSPDGGRGPARDTRVRWALEEVGHPRVRLVSLGAMKEPAHRALHPGSGSWHNGFGEVLGTQGRTAMPAGTQWQLLRGRLISEVTSICQRFPREQQAFNS
jgi:hypothetical protein